MPHPGQIGPREREILTAIVETYISTGSLYLCSVALLPLGLPASDPFWSAPDAPFTQQRAWSGQAFPIDHALAP